MYLAELHRKLIELARSKVRSGVVTERGLAKLCGMSQPHMHNVLKNIRSLSNDSADRMMQALHIGVTDLLWSGTGESDMDVRAVPIVRNRIGPGAEGNLTLFRGIMPLSGHLLAGLVDPVAAFLAPDLVLPTHLAANDLVLLDQNPAVRSQVRGDGAWVVSGQGGLRIRYLRAGGTLLYIANSVTLQDPAKWQAVSLARQDILDVVRARVVWLGRELVKDPV